MALNKDGIEAGAIVDFETHQRLVRQRTQQAKAKAEAPKRRAAKPEEASTSD